jgi:hypothetical protein
MIPCLHSFAQLKQLTERISIDQSKTNALRVIEELDQKSKYTFTYSQPQMAAIRIEKIQLRNMSLGEILQYLESEYHLEFAIRDLNISVKPGVVRVFTPRTEPGEKGIEVTGRVTTAPGNTSMAGVTILIKGTRQGVTTEADGSFKIQVPGERSVLEVSSMGYETQEIRVEKNTSLRIVLKAGTTSLDEVTVSANKRSNTESVLLNERKNAAVISDGISAQNIERTASITTVQALQRVTGVTITDEKYVAVRGLGERSVIAELNGARLSSSNPDRSAVPLDLVPASLLDNITVYKTLSPDHPADATAGLIELKTKSVPGSLTVQFTAQTGTNSEIGLGGSVNSFINSDMGFLGNKIKRKDLSPDFLNLSNLYPGGLPQIQRLFIDSRTSPALAAEAYRINNIMLSFDPVLSTSYKKAQPDQIYTVSMGNTFQVFGGHTLGVIVSANYYRRTEDRYRAQLNQYSLYQGVVTGSFTTTYDPTYGTPIYTPKIYSPMHIPGFISPDATRLSKYLGYEENSGIEKLSYGALAGLTYKFNNANEIQLLQRFRIKKGNQAYVRSFK